MNKLRILFLFVFNLAIISHGQTESKSLISSPPQVDFRVSDKYYLGLPVSVEVVVKNTTKEQIDILLPEDGRTLSGTIKKDGADLQRSVILHWAYEPDRVISLKTGETVREIWSLSKFFADDLPEGTYSCQVNYSYARNPSQVLLKLVSPELRVVVVKPSSKTDMEAMEYFIKARSYYNFADSYPKAVEEFERLFSKYPKSEYARVGKLYAALSYKNLKKDDLAIQSFNSYLENPPLMHPSGYTSDVVKLLLGEAYLRIGDLPRAKHILTELLKYPQIRHFVQARVEQNLQKLELATLK